MYEISTMQIAIGMTLGVSISVYLAVLAYAIDIRTHIRLHGLKSFFNVGTVVGLALGTIMLAVALGMACNCFIITGYTH